MLFKEQPKSSMEEEIFEQAEVLENLLSTHLDGNNIIFEVPAEVKKVVLVASGSSYHCARFAADLFGNVADIEARAIYSSEFLLKSVVPHGNDILYVFTAFKHFVSQIKKIQQSGLLQITKLTAAPAKKKALPQLNRLQHKCFVRPCLS